MSRMLNLVLGATAAITGGLAYKYYKDLEERDACTCNQAGQPQPGQSSYAQLRLFYQKPMVRAWSPTYTGGVTDAELYAEAQRVYQQQLQAMQQDAEPKDAWDRDGDIGLPPDPPREAIPIPMPGQMPNLLPQAEGIPAGSIRLPQGAEAVPDPRAESEGMSRRMPGSALPGGIFFAETEAVRPMRLRDFGMEADMDEILRSIDFERRKREFESKYQENYEEFLRAQEEALRKGRMITATPRRVYITTK